MLVNLREILDIAEKNKYAIGSFNATDIASLEAVIEAAEELNVPVIIAHAEIHNVYVDVSVIGPIMVAAAQKAKVPVCVHLDHGVSFDMIYKAIKYGFTSVMYDASALTYNENILNTKKIVDMCKVLNISVEAELGKLVTLEGSSSAINENAKPEDFYTIPSEAKDFVSKTGIDALAIAFGTSHGFYTKAPVLDFDVVKNVKAATNNIPLVMHGGSGVSPESFIKAIYNGIRKINYYSYMSKAGYEAAKTLMQKDTTKYYHDLNLAAKQAMKDDALKALKVFSMK